VAPRKSRLFHSGQLFHAVAGWGVRAVWVFIVAVFALVQLHILPVLTHDEGVYLVVVVTLLLFLAEILNESRRDIFARLQAQSEILNSIQQSLRSDAQLFTLEESIQDLKERLEKVGAGEKVVIEHFGLDMTFAWDTVSEMFKDLPNATDIEYRLLMLSPESDDLSHFDDDVRTWLLTGRTQAAKIAKELVSLKNSCEKSRRSFTYEMRTYAAFPVVHGLRVTQPFHAAYIAICRWGGEDFNKYRWGSKSYHRVVDVSLSGGQSDLLDIFKGNFTHYWNRKPAAK
jgi:hypothetical protein